jgi:hypothetical protein
MVVDDDPGAVDRAKNEREIATQSRAVAFQVPATQHPAECD